MKLILSTTLALLLPLAAGCSVVTNMTTDKVSFTASVKNESSDPIRIGLAKDGPPFEEEWASPEEVAIGNAKRPEVTWGQTVLPGQTASLPEVSGHFAGGVHGFVRVYAGDPTMADMLAAGRHSPSRLDIPLAEGPNRFIIRDEGDHLTYKCLPPTPTQAPAKD